VKREFGINVFVGMASTLIELVRKCKAGDPEFTIDKILYAGQPMSAADRQWLKEACGTKRIVSIIGTTEANQLGYQCERLEGAFHHVVDDYNWVEVVDDEGAPVPDGQLGRILVTSLQKKNFPLTATPSAMRAACSRQPCSCGRKDRVIEYEGAGRHPRDRYDERESP